MDNRQAFLERYANRLAALLLLFFFGRLALAAGANAVTFDEVIHVFQGVLYWQHEQLYAVVRNPPLVNAVIGLPVSLSFRPALPPDLARYANQDWLEVAKAFTWTVNDNGLQLIATGRLVVMLLATLLGALLYRWSRELFASRAAAVLSLGLYTLDPNVLAHSYLATTDLGLTFFFCLAAYLVWAYWRAAEAGERDWRRYLAAGVAIGGALAAKFSGAILLPGLLIITLYRLWLARPGRRAAGLTLAEVAGWLAVGSLVFLAIYRFEWETLGLDFTLQQAHQAGGHGAFLLGEVSREGWWYYFPVVFALKTPLPALALLSLGLFLFARRRPWAWSSAWPLLLAGGMAATSLGSRVNIGYRYLLPALPLLYLFLALLTDINTQGWETAFQGF
ncbi:MAG: phospholipid carrier-dependent glycosyltransferase [Chloroflexi bacterium]|nr:phospholipid carrier-dependent glycosyltransferase [Chloroflexota bacterium]